MSANHNPSGAYGALLSLDFKLTYLLRKGTENCISKEHLHDIHTAHYNNSPNRTVYNPSYSVSHIGDKFNV